MIVVLIPILIVAALYGAYRLFLLVAAAYGPLAGAACVALVAVIVLGPLLYAWYRHRVLHGHRVDGQRILELSGDWGRLALNAEEKRGRLRLKDREVRFIFGDIAGVAREAQGQSPVLTLRLQGDPQATWRVPMASRRQARDWQEILNLAASKRL